MVKFKTQCNLRILNQDVGALSYFTLIYNMGLVITSQSSIFVQQFRIISPFLKIETIASYRIVLIYSEELSQLNQMNQVILNEIAKRISCGA